MNPELTAAEILEAKRKARAEQETAQENAQEVLSALEQKAGAKPAAETAPPQEHILQFFRYEHLQEPLRSISEPFCQLAHQIASHLPRNPERTVCLRKLLEAKDAAVRTFIAGK